MRIAQVSPLFESVPPKLYGGTERVVATLTDELVREGHEVTLFASGDSHSAAELVACVPQGLRLTGTTESYACHLSMLEKVAQRADEFDLIHFHTEYMHFPLARRLRGTPILSTLHGRLDFPEYQSLFTEYSELALSSISYSQRRPLGTANWMGNVYHGLNPDLIPYNSRGGSSLAFLGRASPEKGLSDAVEIARHTGLRLKVAMKIDPKEVDTREIERLLSEPFVDYAGEIDDGQKAEFLGTARALIFPIRWPEPFGLVMIEAMAAGTPVVAFGNGAVAEVISHGMSGYIVDGVSSACEAIENLHWIERASCRREFDNRFTAARMARDYIALYRKIIADVAIERWNERAWRPVVAVAKAPPPAGGLA